MHCPAFLSSTFKHVNPALCDRLQRLHMKQCSPDPWLQIGEQRASTCERMHAIDIPENGPEDTECYCSPLSLYKLVIIRQSI